MPGIDFSNPSTDLSLGSMGLQFYATILQSQGVASADQYQAEKLEQAATYGELKAVQTGGQMTRQLNQTLGNIDALSRSGKHRSEFADRSGAARQRGARTTHSRLS